MTFFKANFVEYLNKYISFYLYHIYTMPKKRKWKIEDLPTIVSSSYSIREVITKLGLVPAGGNYQQIRHTIKTLRIKTDHFTGQGWRKNRTFKFTPKIHLENILVINSTFQSHKLKLRLFEAGLKNPKCEICDWAEISVDGRVPIELDHINGDHKDNRISNLRILCPNCHSLQPTHRGRNLKK
jgi:hypothetical protein